LQGKDNASIGVGFYTQEYITSSAKPLSIRSCIEDGGTQYFAASRFGGTDIG
jgi:hypothetical protein